MGICEPALLTGAQMRRIPPELRRILSDCVAATDAGVIAERVAAATYDVRGSNCSASVAQ
jgi:hypothetical protein